VTTKRPGTIWDLAHPDATHPSGSPTAQYGSITSPRAFRSKSPSGVRHRSGAQAWSSPAAHTAAYSRAITSALAVMSSWPMSRSSAHSSAAVGSRSAVGSGPSGGGEAQLATAEISSKDTCAPGGTP
jgi:hypothetical protein